MDGGTSLGRNEQQWALAGKFSQFLESTIYPVRFKGWQRERINDAARQRTHGDMRFWCQGGEAFVDEKAFSSVWDCCLVKLVQDVRTQDMGWFYDLTACTHYDTWLLSRTNRSRAGPHLSVPWQDASDDWHPSSNLSSSGLRTLRFY
jgi:hypothetical protein